MRNDLSFINTIKHSEHITNHAALECYKQYLHNQIQ